METAEKKGANSKTRSSCRRSGPISRPTTGLKKRSGPRSRAGAARSVSAKRRQWPVREENPTRRELFDCLWAHDSSPAWKIAQGFREFKHAPH
ncbi:unnamed protein product [Gulo gulo]|uniref:Uncharacterized protein n=1 Tax=Gulo gulo TaxID=48420 RepID=A0A9X9LW53_GULGU|nr:unnamed protein product [Gulo gulo]